MVNRVILLGHCTRDTVQIATQGKAMARMRLATNAVWRDADGERQEATEYHSIVVFGRLAEVAQQYCMKGRGVYLEGRLRTRNFVESSARSTVTLRDEYCACGAPVRALPFSSIAAALRVGA